MKAFCSSVFLLVLHLTLGTALTNDEKSAIIAEQNEKISKLVFRLAEHGDRVAEQGDKICAVKSEIAAIKADIAKYKQILSKLSESCCNAPVTPTTTAAPATTTSAPITTYTSAPITTTTSAPITPGSGIARGLFTRWGRSECPSAISELVYAGVAGGSQYTHGGGAAEYICLPLDPTFNENKHFPGSYFGFVYGAEYEYMPVKSLLNHDVPCAVCRTTHHSSVLMIPGRGECYDGWTEAYHGELGSGYYGHAVSSQYICLDQDYESSNHTDTHVNKNGKLIYPTRAKCGSLPCPPYEDNTLLTCSVCLK